MVLLDFTIDYWISNNQISKDCEKITWETMNNLGKPLWVKIMSKWSQIQIRSNHFTKMDEIWLTYACKYKTRNFIWGMVTMAGRHGLAVRPIKVIGNDNEGRVGVTKLNYKNQGLLWFWIHQWERAIREEEIDRDLRDFQLPEKPVWRTRLLEKTEQQKGVWRFLAFSAMRNGRRWSMMRQATTTRGSDNERLECHWQQMTYWIRRGATCDFWNFFKFMRWHFYPQSFGLLHLDPLYSAIHTHALYFCSTCMNTLQFTCYYIYGHLNLHKLLYCHEIYRCSIMLKFSI